MPAQCKLETMTNPMYVHFQPRQVNETSHRDLRLLGRVGWLGAACGKDPNRRSLAALLTTPDNDLRMDSRMHRNPRVHCLVRVAVFRNSPLTTRYFVLSASGLTPIALTSSIVLRPERKKNARDSINELLRESRAIYDLDIEK